MAAGWFAKVPTTASTIILPHNAPALYRDIVKLRTPRQSEFANSSQSPTRFAERALAFMIGGPCISVDSSDLHPGPA